MLQIVAMGPQESSQERKIKVCVEVCLDCATVWVASLIVNQMK
jgi:hypothetical protein